jgi:AAA domain, putative AbiEii toxin, Type IV TA system
MAMPLPELTIRGFRAFQELVIPRLGQVNIVVGRNNVGKTSLLEALRFLAAGPDFWSVLEDLLVSRREFPTERHGPRRAFSLLRLFHSRPWGAHRTELTIQAKDLAFSMTQKWGVPDETGAHHLGGRNVRYKVESSPPPLGRERFEVLAVEPHGEPMVPLPLDGSLPPGWLEQTHKPSLRHCYISSNGLSDQDLARLWDDVLLHGEESFLLDVLHLIAPDVERLFFIEAIGPSRVPYVRRSGYDVAEPLHSLGGGMLRLFEISLGLVQARGGLLLVDEIENGIHYSVQPDLWTLVFKAAERLDVQVFATTHSWDCIESFQEAAAAHPSAGELIRLHSLDSDLGPDIKATIADEADLAIITRQTIEVR